MSSVKKNFIYNTSYQLLTILIPIITTPYISRVLGADKVGRYSYAYAVAYYFVMAIMLGLNNYGNRTVAKIRDDKEKLSRAFFEIYYMQLLGGILVSIVYIIYCLFYAKNLISWIMLIYVLSAVIDINWFFFGLEKFRLTVSRNIFIKFATTTSIFIFVKTADDLGLYVLILMTGTFVSNLILWFFVKNEVFLCKIQLKDIKKHVKPNLILFIPIVAVSLYKYMDKIMLGILSDMSQVGYYEYSEKILQIPMALVNSLATVMLPKMSNLVATSKTGEENKYIETSIDFSMFLSTSLSFGLMGIAKEFVPLFYGQGYDTCVGLFYILLPSCCFVAFSHVIRTQFLIPHNQDALYIKSVCLGAIVNLMINAILIPYYKAMGAAVGTFIAEGVVCIYQSIKTNKALNVTRLVKNIIPFIISGVIMYSLLLLFPKNNDIGFLIIAKIITGVVAYFTILTIVLFIFFRKRFKTFKNYIYKVRETIKFKS